MDAADVDIADAEPVADETAAADEAAAEDAPSLKTCRRRARRGRSGRGMRKQLRRAPGDWYVIHSYAGCENKVKANPRPACRTSMGDYIFQVEVPTEEVTEIKNGQTRRSTARCCPDTSWCGWNSTTSRGAPSATPRVSPVRWIDRASSPLTIEEVLKFLAPPAAARSSRRPRPPTTALRAAAAECTAVIGSTSRSASRSPSWTVRSPTPPASISEVNAEQRKGQGSGIDLRSRDPGRAELQPGRKDLTRSHSGSGHILPRLQRTWIRKNKPGTRMPPKKKLARIIKLQIQAGAANPAPPVGHWASTASTSWSSARRTTRRPSRSVANHPGRDLRDAKIACLTSS